MFIGFLIFELLHQAWYFVTYSDATTGSALTLNMTMKEQIGCHSKLEWSIWVFSVIFVELVGLMYLTLRLRDIRKAFHEYREARHTLVWFIVTYLVIFVLYFTKWNRTTAGNLMVILLVLLTIYSNYSIVVDDFLEYLFLDGTDSSCLWMCVQTRRSLTNLSFPAWIAELVGGDLCHLTPSHIYDAAVYAASSIDFIWETSLNLQQLTY